MGIVQIPSNQAKLKSAQSRAMKRTRSTHQSMKEYIVAYLFLLPWFIGLFALTIGPIAASLYLSFTRYDILSAPQWIGIQNFVDLFFDVHFLNAIKVTMLYVVLSVPLKLAVALLIAAALNRGLRGLSIYRSIYYVPSLIGSSVAIAILWQQVFGADGVVNHGLALVGIHGTGSWLANPDTAIYTLVILSAWQFGSPMLIFLAGLRQIPQEMYESASIDGAGRRAKFFKITLPLLSPVIFFNLIMQIIGAFQIFTSAFIVSSGTGGPYDSTLFYTLYIYQQGFGYYHMGYASAMAWVLLMVIALFTALSFFTSKYWVFYQDER